MYMLSQNQTDNVFVSSLLSKTTSGGLQEICFGPFRIMFPRRSRSSQQLSASNLKIAASLKTAPVVMFET